MLEEAVEAETPFGGRSRSWSQVATLWVDLRTGSPRRRSGAGQRPEMAEIAQAEARDHPAAEVGQRLSLDGDNWRLVRLVRGDPKIGRMTLHLEKEGP